MSDGQDMLARIKSRSQRPKVARDTSLISSAQDSQAFEAVAMELSPPAADEPAHLQEPPKVTAEKPGVETPSLEDQLAQLIQVAPRRNIRLEENLDKEIERFVQDQDLTIDTLLEACYLILQEDSELQARVVSQASERLAERKEAGKLRRIYSQMQKLKG